MDKLERVINLLRSAAKMHGGHYVGIYLDNVQYMLKAVDGEVQFLVDGELIFSLPEAKGEKNE